MTRTFHFISGLPRSGSTLLCNILAQNPRFHATHTSGCLEALLLLRNNWEKILEHKGNLDWTALERVLAATLQAYHSTDRPVVFDKSRGWLPYIEFAEHILKRKAKIIITVRPVADILASFEKRYRATLPHHQIAGEAENYFRFQTVEGRCDYLLEPHNVVGLACTRVSDALMRGLSDRLLFIEFDRLTRSPEEQMRKVYEFVEEKYFKHDFSRVLQVTQEDDIVQGYYQLHRIREKVEPVPSDARQVLGEPLARKYSALQLRLPSPIAETAKRQPGKQAGSPDAVKLPGAGISLRWGKQPA